MPQRNILLCRLRLGCSLAVLLPLSVASTVRAEVKAGDIFPASTISALKPLTGELPPLAGKVLLVDFWASWCAPCKASFPMMAKLHRDYAARGLVVVAVGLDEKPTAAATFARKMNPPFATVHDDAQSLVKQVVVPTMPTSYLIDRQGRVRFVHEGYHGAVTDRQIRKELETLLAEKN